MIGTSSASRARRRRPAGEAVLGVDTHRDAHVAAVLSLVGEVIGTEEFLATAAGYRELLGWARASGTVRRAGVEGTGSFGAALSRYLLAQGVDVFDVNRFDRADRRRRGKSDPLDAENAARAVLSGRARAQAKTGDGPVEIARMYKLAKDSAVKARTQSISQLKAVLIRADPQLREELAGLGNAELLRTCAGLVDDSLHDEADETAVLHATRLAVGCALVFCAMSVLVDWDAGSLTPLRTVLWVTLSAGLCAVLLPARVTAGSGWLAARAPWRRRVIHTDALTSVRQFDGISSHLVLQDVHGHRLELDPRILAANPLLWHELDTGVRRSLERGTLRLGADLMERLGQHIDAETVEAVLRASGLS
ncbi:transposase [Streptomyces sp. NBC_00078]|uniref:IS110 family transposase n=1 Tax=unclassified Streptomyces TaxID=2593676 RepID=UPI002250F311|nr:transposase [Streptomyces sp. NBC_00078]MCX5424787.1 IS110 family transposase [Streptomyces sp. NBC_00078]